MPAPLTLRVRRGAVAAVIAGIALGASAAPAHAFPTHTDVADSFDRSALGPNWSTGSFAAAASTPTLGSNRIQFPSTWASAHYAPATFGATQEAHILKRSPGFIGVTACVTSPGLTGNGFAVIANGDGTLTIAKFAGGSRSDLATGIPAGNITTWDSVGIRVAAGTVSAYARKGTNAWQLVGSANDSAAATCSGHVGVIGQSVSADDFRGGGTAPGSGDTTAPTVAMTQPSNGATVSGSVTLAANATDNVGVTGVRFQVDGQDVGAEVTSAPWTLSWNSAQVTNGQHSVRAIARDAAGNTATSSAVTVTVSNQAAPPDTDVSTAQGFADSIGVNTHFGYLNELYCSQTATTINRLRTLGVRNIRESFRTASELDARCPVNSSGPRVEETLIGLAAESSPGAGDSIKTQLVLNALHAGEKDPPDALAAIGDGQAADADDDLLDRARVLRAAGALRGLEGPNEYDTKEKTLYKGSEFCDWQPSWCAGNPTLWSEYTYPWRPKLRTVTEGMATQIAQADGLAGVPVTMASFARGFNWVREFSQGTSEQKDSYRAYLRNDNGSAYDPTPFIDEGNLHYYFGESTPEATVAEWAADAEGLTTAEQPFVATETGFNDLAGDDRSISREAAAIYLPRLLFALRNEGAEGIYLYQLLDQVQGDTFERKWGLVDATMTPKPAYHALRRLLQALKDPSGAYTSGQAPQIQVSAGATPVQSSVLKRRNGAFDVAVWRPVSVFDGSTDTNVSPAPVNATVSFPSGYSAKTLTPSQNLSEDVTPASWSGAAGSPLSLSLAGELVLVRLTPTS